jgi:hypothetical protein
MDNPVPIDDKYLEMATKIVASVVSSQVSGQISINNPHAVPVLLRAVAIELANLRRGEYELPQKK